MKGQAVVVTGGGGGIGQALVEGFAAEGADVVVADVDAGRAQLAAEMVGQMGGRGLAVQADLSHTADVNRVIDTALDAFGRVDVLCNNAGIVDGFHLADELDEGLWDRVMDINLKAAYLAVRRALPSMLERNYGVILNTASIAGLRGGRHGLAYTVSKHGLLGLTQSIAASFGDDGIRCNAISPGGVNTPILGTLRGDVPPRVQRMQARYANRPPRDEPSAIANLAVFLASDKAESINGVNIVVDRGWLVW
jgi:NAD(P)-dependent dehydrogenase (short-subunit alcohol dehydrogenase family)